VAMRRRLQRKAPSHERWIISYADFITLLFAFFVTMYSMSRVDAKKFGSAVESIHRALGSVVPLSMPFGGHGFFGDDKKAEMIMQDPLLLENQLALGQILKSAQAQPGLANVAKGIRVTMDERGLIISFPDAAIFEPCSEQIRPEVRPLLDEVGESLLKVSSPVRVEGHTDNGTCPEWPSNWELSAARASAVIRYLTGRFNFNPARLSAAGYASFRPVDTNETESGRERNRRVDIVILDEKATAKEPNPLQAAAPVVTEALRSSPPTPPAKKAEHAAAPRPAPQPRRAHSSEPSRAARRPFPYWK
jgi:chemotaxis protein MotB